MTAPLTKPRLALADALLESDARYFELAAETDDLGGAQLAVIPGLADVPAAAVVQRIDPSHLPEDTEAWLDHVEGRLWHSAAALCRFYLQAPAPPLESALRRRGYRARGEVGLATETPPMRADAAVSLRPVETPADWSAKRELHAAAGTAPDGFRMPAERWIELERRKFETGELELYLIESGGAVCGAIAAMECGELLRLKNVVLHPSCRGKGIAKRAFTLVALMAPRRGLRGAGGFAFAERAQGGLLMQVGFEAVTQQVEWTKPADPKMETP